MVSKIDIKVKEAVKEHLEKIKEAKDIYTLFSVLKYPKDFIFETNTERKKATFEFKKEDDERISKIYSVFGFENKATGKKDKLPVFLIECNSIAPSFIRSVVTTFDRQYLPPYLLIFTIDYFKIVFAFPKHEKIEAGKHKLRVTKLVVDKSYLHYTDVETISNMVYEGEDHWAHIRKKWDNAFSVSRVTDDFFEDYKDIFFKIRNSLIKQKIEIKEAHEFTLQFLNRIMFVYFIAKKEWVKYSKFMNWFWEEYKKQGKFGSDEFYDTWLKQLFFKAFNNHANELEGLPEEVKNAVSASPYLNGGLFRENEILDTLPIKISDSLFKEVFEFFEDYNFTIKEDLPIEEEVAVDPQMIGYVYESLANVSDHIYESEKKLRDIFDERGRHGIFYTPRIEVDFMCRRSLVEYFSKNLPGVKKDVFYHLVFDQHEEKLDYEKKIEKDFWPNFEGVLDELSIVDPACGSGAFLVGMLNVLTELYKITYNHLGRTKNDYDIKMRIAMRSLYGVDVMPWAIHAAELRLWLQLIVDSNLTLSQLRTGGGPLLPNLTMNLRIGDSLVQEIGGINLTLRSNDLPQYLKDKLNELKIEKQNYFSSNKKGRFSKPEEIENEQINLFLQIINDRINKLKSRLFDVDKIKKTAQIGLDGRVLQTPQKKLEAESQEVEQTKQDIQSEIKHLESAREDLKDREKRKFVWDIDFAEIFGDKGGFDIVIGNPPYVRQEMIAPPEKLKADVDKSDRDNYKDKLLESVKNKFPVIEKIDRKSDLYVYFYFHGLSLLNNKGSFCFITSNSWLDVGYGKDLQEFLLKYVPINAIYDSPKRSFAHADVNTVIALFSSPNVSQRSLHDWIGGSGGSIKTWPALNETAKFIMFNKALGEAHSSKNLIQIEKIKAGAEGGEITELVKNVVKTPDYRVFPVLQSDLMNDGWEYPEDYKGERFKAGKYEGNKWGGKYLRAPDIFYTILEKGEGKIVKLKDIADIKFGIKTGANEFFYLDEEAQKRWAIENEFLVNIFKGPKESKTIKIKPQKLKFSLFLCNKPKSELKGTNALKYIEWGETQEIEIKGGGDKGKKIIGFQNISTIKARTPWYSLGTRKKPDLIFPCGIRKNFKIFLNEGVFVDKRLYEIYSSSNKENLAIVLNSTLFFFMIELLCRNYGGGGGPIDATIEEVDALYTLNPNLRDYGKIPIRDILSIFEECGLDPTKPIREQEPNPLPDRAELDKIIFDELALTEEERNEVYWSVCELVKQRLDKAKSLKI
jgi:hypothetical protein